MFFFSCDMRCSSWLSFQKVFVYILFCTIIIQNSLDILLWRMNKWMVFVRSWGQSWYCNGNCAIQCLFYPKQSFNKQTMTVTNEQIVSSVILFLLSLCTRTFSWLILFFFIGVTISALHPIENFTFECILCIQI